MINQLKKLFVVSIATLMSVQAAPADELVEAIPDLNQTLPTKLYSGFLSVTATKALHYVFVESQSGNASVDPVLIWFNGGPGCSSLLGFFQENGPIVVEGTSAKPSISVNPHPWNVRANTLYIESPAGVGYSIANTTADYSHNDMSQSEDAFAALQEWYRKFPEYLPNPLFVSGESYGGVYVPYLSWQLYQNNLKSRFQNLTAYNLKGFMVGNGATNWDFDVSPSFPGTLYGFNLIPTPLMKAYTDLGCVYYFNDFRPHDGPKDCDPLLDKMQDLVKDLNWYDLYQPADFNPLSAEERMGSVIINGEEKTYRRGRTKAEYTPWLPRTATGGQLYDLHVEADYLTDYVNRADVRKAFHIPDFAPAWEQCSSKIDYHLQNEASMWIYSVLQRSGIRMMFYSGDTDGAVPTYGTKRWIESLAWETKRDWRPWLTAGQVSGYIKEYDGLDFVTIKGVGHMAP